MNVNASAKRVLLYGDSLTWARDPRGHRVKRFDVQTRWPGRLQVLLGDGYELIEEGLRGRTLKGANPYAPYLDGLAQFGPIFASHLPLDLVVLFLGSNDVYKRTGKSAEMIADGLAGYRAVIKRWCTKYRMNVPPMLLVAPPVIRDASITALTTMYRGGEAKTQQMRRLFESKANDYGWEFFDSAGVVDSSPLDGVHLDAEANERLASALEPVVGKIVPVKMVARRNS
jgi:lysophospholipase L1-like esterase